MNRNLLSSSVLVFLLLPFVVLFTLMPGRFQIDWSEFFWALKNSSIQAFFSTLLTLLLGFWASLGLIKTQNERPAFHAVLVILCLVPQFMPVIVVLISLMNGLQPFPMGTVGVVLCHTFSYFGMAALLIQNQASEVLPRMVEVARVSGSSRWMFWQRIGLPILKKDFLLMGLYFFALFFTSFSIPLIVGGGRGTTLEVLIFEKMRLSTDWSPAVTLSVIQSVLMLLLSFFALGSRANYNSEKKLDGWLGSYSGSLFILLVMAGFFASYASGVLDGLSQFGNLEVYKEDLLPAMLNSLVIAFLTFMALYFFMMLFCWTMNVPRFLDVFLNGYVAPSTALTCFGILLYFPAEHEWSFFKIPMAFLLLSFPAVYRLGWGEKLNSLSMQVQVAQVMGARPLQIWLSVIWPQMRSISIYMAGLVATWACGDFAVSRILSTRDFTLSLILESLLTSYRMGLASLLSVLLIFLCCACFFIVMGIDYVNRRKLEDF